MEDDVMIGDTFERKSHPGEAWEVTHIGQGLTMQRNGERRRMLGTVRVARLEAGTSWAFVELGGLTDPEGGWRAVEARHVLVRGEP
jgi:hypothetical protein